MVCKNCRAVIPDGSEQCPYCGAAQQGGAEAAQAAAPGRVCPVCGAKMEDGQMFCGECGALYAEPEQKKPPRPPEPEKEKPVKREEPKQPRPLAIQKKSGLIMAFAWICLTAAVLFFLLAADSHLVLRFLNIRTSYFAAEPEVLVRLLAPSIYLRTAFFLVSALGLFLCRFRAGRMTDPAAGKGIRRLGIMWGVGAMFYLVYSVLYIYWAIRYRDAEFWMSVLFLPCFYLFGVLSIFLCRRQAGRAADPRGGRAALRWAGVYTAVMALHFLLSAITIFRDYRYGFM